MEKERIIWSLKQFRDGDVTSKDYQKQLFDTFVKVVYLWDEKIETHYYYNDEKNVLTLSLKEGAEGGGLGAVRDSRAGYKLYVDGFNTMEAIHNYLSDLMNCTLVESPEKIV